MRPWLGILVVGLSAACGSSSAATDAGALRIDVGPLTLDVGTGGGGTRDAGNGGTTDPDGTATDAGPAEPSDGGGGGGTDAGGGGSPTLTGSCTYVLSTNTRRCAEYYSLTDIQLTNVRDTCTTTTLWHDGAWSTSECTRTDAVGICTRDVPAGGSDLAGHYVTVYYSDNGYTVDSARTACEGSANSTFSTP